MKSKLKLLLRPVVFCIVLLVMLATLNSLFMPVWDRYNNYFTLNGFYKEPEDTIETVFLGASIPASTIAPTDLYKEYGICAYSLANTQQPVITSYYLLQDAYNRHSETLKTVFFDVSELRSTGNDQIFHKSIDYMKLSPLKIKAIYEYCDGDMSKMFNFIFPLSEFHNRWTELEWKDFEYFGKDPVNGTRGYDFKLNTYRYSEKSLDSIYVKNVTLYEEAEPEPLFEDSLEYFDRMAKFCEEKGIKLVLMKLYAFNWSSALHNSIQEVADSYGLEFIDFNFEPYASESEYFMPFDSRDGRHSNYHGATKITSWIGQYLVDECGATDVRGDSRYAHMEDQLDRYDKVYYREYELGQTENIVDYLTVALRDDNTIFLTVREDAAKALTDAQREFFRDIGLYKLAALEVGDSYISIIENGKVTYENVLSAVTDKSDNYLTHFVKLSDGTRVSLVSGFRNNKNISSCTFDSMEKSDNKKGINIVVYSNEYEELISSEAFDTSSTAPRNFYKSDFYKLTDNAAAIKNYSKNSYFTQSQIYKAMYDAKNSGVPTEEIVANNDIFSHIDKYIKDENNVIIVSVKDEGSNKLSEKDRQAFAELGLLNLSELELRDSYIAVIEGGQVVYDVREGGSKTPLVYKTDNFEVTSGGFAAGNISSIKINGKEYSENVRGINVVVYNKKYNQVFDVSYFDTYTKPIKTSAVIAVG